MGNLQDEQYKKGREGEKHVASQIATCGYKVLYIGGCQLYHITGEKYYSVDLEFFGEGKTIWVQVKNKPPRKKYPDTGMEWWRYQHLVKHQKESGLPVLVLFTDTDGNKLIYGEWLNNITNCQSNMGFNGNGKTGDTMIYWYIPRDWGHQKPIPKNSATLRTLAELFTVEKRETRALAKRFEDTNMFEAIQCPPK